MNLRHCYSDAAAANIYSNFKWLGAALNLVKIKSPFGSVQTNPQADAWWVPPFMKKNVFLKQPTDYVFLINLDIWMGKPLNILAVPLLRGMLNV